MKTIITGLVLLLSTNLFANCEKVKTIFPKDASFRIETPTQTSDIRIDTMWDYILTNDLAKKKLFSCEVKNKKITITTTDLGKGKSGLGWFKVNRSEKQISKMVYDLKTKVLTFEFTEEKRSAAINTLTSELFFNNTQTRGTVVYWK